MPLIPLRRTFVAPYYPVTPTGIHKRIAEDVEKSGTTSRGERYRRKRKRMCKLYEKSSLAVRGLRLRSRLRLRPSIS